MTLELKTTLLLSKVRCLTGSLGGLVEACCCQPIDVIKTRLQLDHAGKYKGKHFFHRLALLATCDLGQQVKYVQVS